MVIPFWPIHFDYGLDMLVVTIGSPRFGGLLERRFQFFWNGYFWEELPLPFYRRYGFAW